MTTAAATASSALRVPNNCFSIGPVKIQIMDFPMISGDTVGTATATSLAVVDYAILIGAPAQSAVPTYSGNVATFAFADPAATIKGHVICFGR